MLKSLSGLAAGLLFGAGLASSGMTDTAKVLGFLDIFGAWDPDLAYVMGSAVITSALGFWFVLRRSNPVFTKEFLLPTSTVIDKQLLTGGALFGLGWGLFGYCPGPAVAALVYLSPATMCFVIAMLLGMALGNRLAKLEIWV
jgi:uncharacterized membrane protein YedE/YeeE